MGRRGVLGCSVVGAVAAVVSVWLTACGDARGPGKPGRSNAGSASRSVQTLDAPAASGDRDVNGDGLDDFVVRAWLPGGESRTVVVFGSRERQPVDAANVGDRGLSIAFAGFPEVAGAADEARIVGDVDGDGFDDLALTTGYGDQGFIVFGRRRGGSMRIDVRRPNPQDAMEVRGVLGNGDQMGAIEPAGDFDADGYNDVLVPGPARRRRVVSVLRGGPRLAAVHVLKPSSRVVPIRGTRGWGNSAVGIGNHGDDRRADLAIAAQMRGRTVEMGVWILFARRGVRGYKLVAGGHTRAVSGGHHRTGYYVPLCGRARASVGRCPADLGSPAASFWLSPSEAIGDIDQDGFDDLLIVRLDSRQRHVTRVLFGGSATSPRRTRTLPVRDAYGTGDVDGDHIPDMVASQRGRGTGILHLNRSGRAVAMTPLRGPGIYGVSPIGDRDGDGFSDLLVVGNNRAVLLYGAADRSAVHVWRPGSRVTSIGSVD